MRFGDQRRSTSDCRALSTSPALPRGKKLSPFLSWLPRPSGSPKGGGGPPRVGQAMVSRPVGAGGRRAVGDLSFKVDTRVSSRWLPVRSPRPARVAARRPSPPVLEGSRGPGAGREWSTALNMNSGRGFRKPGGGGNARASEGYQGLRRAPRVSAAGTAAGRGYRASRAPRPASAALRPVRVARAGRRHGSGTARERGRRRKRPTSRRECEAGPGASIKVPHRSRAGRAARADAWTGRVDGRGRPGPPPRRGAETRTSTPPE